MDGTDHEKCMLLALEMAEEAYREREAPVGCVIVRQADGAVLGRGANRRNASGNALAHAEIIAIDEACRVMGDWRLEGTALYVTVEPCPMCAGAIVSARIPLVVYGAPNVKAGCAGSIYNLLEEPRFNHRCQVISGVLREECAGLMTRFFRSEIS